MIIGVNCGHTVTGQPGSGARGYLIESDETRTVGYALMKLLRQQGHTVIDCTDDYANSTGENLRNICALANAQPLDLFVSIHFNAGQGKGVECWTYGSGDVGGASRIKHNIAMLGFRDRGIKDGSHLYVIKYTTARAVLVEVCFVDTKSDAEQYKKVGASRIAAVICEGITGEKITDEEELTMSQYEELKKRIDEMSSNLTGIINDMDRKLEKLYNPMIYNYIDNNMPEWAREAVQWAVDSGIIHGTENGLELDDKDLRYLVMLKRIHDNK
ncbi:MAG: N-acetylmuramoyl-L-alanine amidase [Monoglobaceae bacterium]